MTYRYFTTIFRPLLIFFIIWQFSNAVIPDWCEDPAPIEMNFIVSSHIGPIVTDSNAIFAYLCHENMSKLYQQFEDDIASMTTGCSEYDNNSAMLLSIWNGVKNLYYFCNNSITFKLMSANTFWIEIQEPDDNFCIMKGRFQNFDDFKNFHILVEGENAKYSPQNFTIVGLESYSENVYATEYDPNLRVLYTQPTIFSQYLIEDSNEFQFVIEKELSDETPESFLTFQPFKYRSTRGQIYSQVILTLFNEEETYFIIRFDSAENALSFASYIGKFAIPEPEGLQISNTLQNFLDLRK